MKFKFILIFLSFAMSFRLYSSEQQLFLKFIRSPIFQITYQFNQYINKRLRDNALDQKMRDRVELYFKKNKIIPKVLEKKEKLRITYNNGLQRFNLDKLSTENLKVSIKDIFSKNIRITVLKKEYPNLKSLLKKDRSIKLRPLVEIVEINFIVNDFWKDSEKVVIQFNRSLRQILSSCTKEIDNIRFGIILITENASFENLESMYPGYLKVFYKEMLVSQNPDMLLYKKIKSFHVNNKILKETESLIRKLYACIKSYTDLNKEKI